MSMCNTKKLPYQGLWFVPHVSLDYMIENKPVTKCNTHMLSVSIYVVKIMTKVIPH